jgi:hypothetical protein
LVGEPCERVSLKEVVKAWFIAVVAAEVFDQVEDDMIDEEGELDEQYVAIKTDYETEAIGEE